MQSTYPILNGAQITYKQCSLQTHAMDPEIIQKALHQREVRLRARYAYEKRRCENDPEYKAQKMAKKHARALERYRTDPEYAEKRKQYQRELYAKKKATGSCPDMDEKS